MHKVDKKVLIFVCLVMSLLQAYLIPKAANAQNNTTVSNLTSDQNLTMPANVTSSGPQPVSMVPDDEADVISKKTGAAAPAEENISLDLKDIEVKELFKILSVKTGLTITSTPKVSGRITLSLDNVDFKNALVLIRKQLKEQLRIMAISTDNTIDFMTVEEYQNFYNKQQNSTVRNVSQKPGNFTAGNTDDMNVNIDMAGNKNDVDRNKAESGETKKDEKITLDLKGVDISELFKMLSVKSGLTIVTTPQVSGRITVFLNNLSFDDALDVILTLQNLACERIGNLIKIMTAGEYEQLYGKKFSEKKKVKTIKLAYAKPANVSNVISSLKSDIGKILVDESSGTLILIDSPPALALMESAIKELDLPLETAVFDINYANPADIKTYITDLITPGVGQLIIDQRSNKAIVSDLPQRLVKIKKLMSEFDETSRQVLITGEIIQIALSDKFQRGIDWEHILRDKKLHGLDFVGKFPISPVPSTNYGKISVGTLDSDDYTAILNLMQDYGKVDILSRPQVVAMNKEEARILVGSREPYVTQQQSQAQASTVTSETVEFIDVGVKLKVVPTINKDGFITMKIKPEISSVRETFKTSAGSQIPIVETSETETIVKVKDGAMVMIGGLIKKEHRDSTSGFPFVSKIPVLGGLFSNRTKEDKRTELVIFLRPKLISGDLKPTVEK